MPASGGADGTGTAGDSETAGTLGSGSAGITAGTAGMTGAAGAAGAAATIGAAGTTGGSKDGGGAGAGGVGAGGNAGAGGLDAGDDGVAGNDGSAGERGDGGVVGVDGGSDADDGSAIGTTTTLYIHGRNPGGLPVGWSYWLKQRPGINAVPVNWSGTDPIAQTNATIRHALDTYCTGNNWCYVACHSAGCAQIGYAMAQYGTTGGVDSWNIYWIAAAGSAEGGSELADLGKFFGGPLPLDADLQTTVMRQMYNHDSTNGVIHWMFAGSGYSDADPELNADGALLPGDDDLAVAYHSSCGVNNTAWSGTSFWCNSTDLFCSGDRLDLGMHSYLWQDHVIQYLDTGGLYSHFIADSNEGICSRMFAYVAQNAL